MASPISPVVRGPSSASAAQPGDLLLAVHEFAARSADEITLHKGDKVELIEKDDDFGDGWYLGKHLQSGSTGLFPEVLDPKPGHAPSRSVDAQRPTVQIPSNAAQQPVKPLPQPPGSPSQNSRGLPTTVTASQGQISSSRSPQSNAVMNEMHSVINEQLTDLRTPTYSNGAPGRGPAHAAKPSTGSVARAYIAGEETDEEEEVAAAQGTTLTPDAVKQWTPDQVATYLSSVGVEKSHCDLFREEEFTGEVLLELDQSQVFMKEFNLGPVGRRMRTWQKIKVLQDEVFGRLPTPQHTSSAASPVASHFAASSLAASQSTQPSSQGLGLRDDKGGKHASFDKGWLMPDDEPSGHRPQSSRSRLQALSDRDSLAVSDRASHNSLLVGTDHSDLGHGDHGYLSTEADGAGHGRSMRNVLRKREGSNSGVGAGAGAGITDHRRLSSYGSEGRRASRGFFSWRSRDASPHKSTTDPGVQGGLQASLQGLASPVSGGFSAALPSPGAGSKRASATNNNSVRIVSEPLQQGSASSPTVTKLEYDDVAPRSQQKRDSGHDKSAGATRRGLRAISDAVTGRERTAASSTSAKVLPDDAGVYTSPVEASPLYPPDSAVSASMTPLSAAPSSALDDLAAARRKGKQGTSAYLRGLEKRSYAEQSIGADYHGWMRKKSSNLMTTWKPRLFVLKGRRLSYYYGENDTEEKGLIDISNHRVLPADNDIFTGLHATLTGAGGAAAGAATSDNWGTGSYANTQPPSTSPHASTAPGAAPLPASPYIFKLVPPRVGLSKGVNFTKPAVHYFALPSRNEGRVWMAAMMKATIDRDESKEVASTYQQKTISLEQARARRELPPFLKGVAEEGYGYESSASRASRASRDPGTDAHDTSASASDAGAQEAETRPRGPAVAYGAGTNTGADDHATALPPLPAASPPSRTSTASPALSRRTTNTANTAASGAHSTSANSTNSYTTADSASTVGGDASARYVTNLEHDLAPGPPSRSSSSTASVYHASRNKSPPQQHSHSHSRGRPSVDTTTSKKPPLSSASQMARQLSPAAGQPASAAAPLQSRLQRGSTTSSRTSLRSARSTRSGQRTPSEADGDVMERMKSAGLI